MAVLFRYPNAASPTTTLTFNASLVSITRKRVMPIQNMEIAVSGREYVRELHTNIEEIWDVDFSDLHEADDAGNSGFTSLNTFIQTTLNFMSNTFDVTDADGTTLSCRYVRGLADFIEGGGLQSSNGRATKFTGTIVVRKTL